MPKGEKNSKVSEVKPTPLKVLFVEDSQNDADMIIRELQRGGFEPRWKRIETAEDMEEAISSEYWEIIISDYKMPHFTGLEALQLLQKKNTDIPFIIVSGTIGEEIAVSIMKAGASDYIMKDKLARLPSAVERELRDLETSRGRKIADEALEKSSKEIFDLYNNAPCGYHSVDKDGLIIRMNDTELKWLGYEREEIVGKKKFTYLVPLDDVDAFNKAFPILKKRGYIHDFEGRYRRKDGSVFHVLINSTTVRDEKGNFLYSRSSIFDITDRKKAEEALHERDQQYRSMMQMAMDGFWIVDLQQRFIDVNDSYCRMSGYSKEELLKMTIPEIEENENTEEVRNHTARLVESGVERFESRHRRKDGSIFNVEISTTYLPHMGGRIYVFVRDITESRLAESKLRESENLFRTLTSITPTGIYLTDTGGNCIYANEKWLEMAGMGLEEALGTGWIKALHPEDREFVISNWNKMVESKRKWHLEYRFITPSGKITMILGLASELRDENGNVTGYVGTNIDITEIKQLQKALEKRILALTSPLESTEDIKFEDLFNVNEIQKIQDSFAGATGVASIITDIYGKPITKPSNFCHLCEHIIRKTEKGLANCYHSDTVIGRKNEGGPIVQPCLSGGLWDAGASICVGDRHIANWLIGQVLDSSVDQKKMMDYAREIGADENEFSKALKSVARMSRDQFDKVANSLFLIAGQLSRLALQNVQQARYISESKKAEQDLMRSEARFRGYFESQLIGIAITSIGKGWIEVNDRLCEMLGYSKEELAKMTWAEITHTDDLKADVQHFEEVIAGKKDRYSMVKRFIRKDGNIIWTNLGVSCVRKEDGKVDYFVAFLLDISEQKRMEERLRQSEKMEAIGQLAGGIAHDFNNQLAGIMGFAEMLAERLEDRNLREYAENIIRASKRSSDLTRDLLAFSRKGKIFWFVFILSGFLFYVSGS